MFVLRDGGRLASALECISSGDDLTPGGDRVEACLFFSPVNTCADSSVPVSPSCALYGLSLYALISHVHLSTRVDLTIGVMEIHRECITAG